MTDERIQKIKSAVEAADHISPEKKTELLAVLAEAQTRYCRGGANKRGGG